MFSSWLWRFQSMSPVPLLWVKAEAEHRGGLSCSLPGCWRNRAQGKTLERDQSGDKCSPQSHTDTPRSALLIWAPLQPSELTIQLDWYSCRGHCSYDTDLNYRSFDSGLASSSLHDQMLGTNFSFFSVHFLIHSAFTWLQEV